jgi:DME family drug/metabolite transporter
MIQRPGERIRLAFAGLPEHRQGLIAVTTAAILWSSGGLLIKAVSLDALGVTMWRALFAAVAIALLGRAPFPRPWQTSRLGWALALSYAATLLLFVSGTKLTTAANAIFLQYTAPLYALFLSAILLKERPTKIELITVAVALGGMCLFFVGRIEPRDTAGNLCAISSGVAMAFLFVLLRMPGCTAEMRPQSMVLGNLLLVVGLGVVNLARRDMALFTPDLPDLAGLAFLGIIQIGLAYVLFGYGIARVRAVEALLIGMIEPVLNPVWVFLVLGEAPGWWAVVGGAVIVVAVTGRTIASERRSVILPGAEFEVEAAEP